MRNEARRASRPAVIASVIALLMVGAATAIAARPDDTGSRLVSPSACDAGLLRVEWQIAVGDPGRVIAARIGGAASRCDRRRVSVTLADRDGGFVGGGSGVFTRVGSGSTSVVVELQSSAGDGVRAADIAVVDVSVSNRANP